MTILGIERSIRGRLFVALASAALALCCAGISTAQQTPTQPDRSPGIGNYVDSVTGGPSVDESGGRRGGRSGRGGRGGTSETGGASDSESGSKSTESSESKTPKGESTSGKGVRTIKSTGAPVGVTGPKGPYEPILKRPVDYGDVPDGGETLTLSTAETTMTVSQFLDTLATATHWNILPTEAVSEVGLRFWIEEMTPRQALEVLKFHGVYYYFDEETNFLYIMTKEEYLLQEFGETIEREFVVKHADLKDMEAIVESFMSANGRMITDPRTGRLIVTDTSDNLEAIETTLQSLDVPMQPKTFVLTYLDAESVVESVESILSDRGTAYADPRMNVVTVTDLPSRMLQIEELITTLDQKQETRTWTLSYLEPDDFVERTENLIPEEMGQVTTDDLVHQVTVTAIPERLNRIDELVTMWDIPRKQVQIEAYLVLANSNVTRNLGIDWTYFDELNGDPLAIRNGTRTPNLETAPQTGQLYSLGQLPSPIYDINPWTSDVYRDITGAPIIESLTGNRLTVVLDYLDQHGDATILSRPRVTVQDGEEASFENTEERPYQSAGISSYGGYNPNTSNTNYNQIIPLQVQFIEVGTILKVMPKITEENNVVLELDIEDSTASNVTVTTGNQESTIPQKTKANAKTLVEVKSKETIVIGGLRNVSTDNDVDKVPILGDLPFVSRLFKTTKKDHKQRELLVFITPTIVDEYSSQEAERLSRLDAETVEQLRDDKKGAVGRAIKKITGGREEKEITIGEFGDLLYEGEPISMDALKEKLGSLKVKGLPVVILAHPRTPKEVTTAVQTAAVDAGLNVRFDRKAYPFVAPSVDAREKEAEEVRQQ